jgi:hypothetical protein
MNVEPVSVEHPRFVPCQPSTHGELKQLSTIAIWMQGSMGHHGSGFRNKSMGFKHSRPNKPVQWGKTCMPERTRFSVGPSMTLNMRWVTSREYQREWTGGFRSLLVSLQHGNLIGAVKIKQMPI